MFTYKNICLNQQYAPSNVAYQQSYGLHILWQW